MSRSLPLTLCCGALLFAISACTPPPPPSRADAARAEACRNRVEAVYDRAHRSDIYTDTGSITERGQITAAGTASDTQVLSDQYGRNQDLNACLHEQDSGTP